MTGIAPEEEALGTCGSLRFDAHGQIKRTHRRRMHAALLPLKLDSRDVVVWDKLRLEGVQERPL